MKTDFQETGKLYRKLDAYTKGNASQAMPDSSALYYFGSSIQFKSCRSFRAFLEAKHKGHFFYVERAGA